MVRRLIAHGNADATAAKIAQYQAALDAQRAERMVAIRTEGAHS